MLHNYTDPAPGVDLAAYHAQYIETISQYLDLFKFVLEDHVNLALQVGCIIEVQLLVYKKPLTEGKT